MALNNQAVEAQIQSLLAQRRNEVAAPTNVAGIANEGQLGNAAAQLNRDLPHGQIAICFLSIA